MKQTMLRGASLLLIDNGDPVLALRIKADSSYLTGIGGKLEAGETVRQCAIRETFEETGAQLTIIDSPDCLKVDFEGKISTEEAENGAIAQIHKAANSPPGKPWDYSLTHTKLQVDIFLGTLNKAPRAVEKHPAFIAISPEILPDVLQNGLNIAQARQDNSIRIIGGELPLPHQVSQRVFIRDSLEALFIALGDDFVRFLHDAERLL